MSDQNIVRATGLLVIEAINSNPNGDPERESSPRQRPDGKGEISPVSIKRKLAEETLAQEQYLMRTLMDNLPDHIYFKDHRIFLPVIPGRYSTNDVNAIGRTGGRIPGKASGGCGRL